jgi:hypothetical protein
MELKNTERKVDELIVLYQATRQALQALDPRASSLPEVAPRVGSEDSTVAASAAYTEASCESKESDNNNNSPTSRRTSSSLAQCVVLLETSIPQALQHELLPILDKFRQRLAEKDPVTGNPRYGEKTQTRVAELVAAFDALSQAMLPSPTLTNSQGQGHTLDFLMELQSKVQKEQQEQERVQKEQEENVRLEQERVEKEAEKVRLEKEQQEQRKQQEEQERIARENEMFRQQAEQARRLRLDLQSAERAWVASVAKSPDGVKEQLNVLKQSTANDPQAQKAALYALLQLFQQINAHPEETNFRRIRRDHEKFDQDIGRHKGGREILIAAGFELGAIDEVPCFISKEPDIEKDMDGWSAWFDLLKATLKIVQENQ